jgi:hypothetical protein
MIGNQQPTGMVSADLTHGPAVVARNVLDRFGVPGRLRHVRDFIWRGGELGLQIDLRENGLPGDVYYELRAEWHTAVLASTDVQPGVELRGRSVVDGRWLRSKAGYLICVGIDLDSAAAIYLRAGRILSFVPFLQRPADQVEQALAADLSSYVTSFLDHCPTVPQARAAAGQQLTRLHLTDDPNRGRRPFH